MSYTIFVTLFSSGSKFRPVSNFMELYALVTLAAHSYVCALDVASFPGPTKLSVAISMVAFPYCKQRKAGRGLGTRLPLMITISLCVVKYI